MRRRRRCGCGSRRREHIHRQSAARTNTLRHRGIDDTGLRRRPTSKLIPHRASTESATAKAAIKAALHAGGLLHALRLPKATSSRLHHPAATHRSLAHPSEVARAAAGMTTALRLLRLLLRKASTSTTKAALVEATRRKLPAALVEAAAKALLGRRLLRLSGEAASAHIEAAAAEASGGGGRDGCRCRCGVESRTKPSSSTTKASRIEASLGREAATASTEAARLRRCRGGRRDWSGVESGTKPSSTSAAKALVEATGCKALLLRRLLRLRAKALIEPASSEAHLLLRCLLRSKTAAKPSSHHRRILEAASTGLRRRRKSEGHASIASSSLHHTASHLRAHHLLLSELLLPAEASGSKALLRLGDARIDERVHQLVHRIHWWSDGGRVRTDEIHASTRLVAFDRHRLRLLRHSRREHLLRRHLDDGRSVDLDLIRAIPRIVLEDGALRLAAVVTLNDQSRADRVLLLVAVRPPAPPSSCAGGSAARASRVW